MTSVAPVGRKQQQHLSLKAPIRWGIVGCGDVCERKSGPAFFKSTNSSLVAVMRRNKEKAEKFAALHKIPKVYDSYEQVIRDDEVDAVYVATPPGVDRIRLARLVANANKPCLMEKPLARDYKEAQEIVQIFQNAGLPLYTAYYRQAMPKFVAAESALAKIGLVTSVSVVLSQPRHKDDKAHWHYDLATSGGGILLDIGSHMLDMVDHLLGPIQDCHGLATQTVSDQGWIEERPKLEDNIRGIWKHTLVDDKTGRAYQVLGSGMFDFSASGAAEDKIEIIGIEGRLSFSCFNNADPPKLTLADGSVQMLESKTPQYVHQPLVQAIVNELLQGGATENKNPVSSTGESAARTSRVLDQLLNGRSSWKDDYVSP